MSIQKGRTVQSKEACVGQKVKLVSFPIDQPILVVKDIVNKNLIVQLEESDSCDFSQEYNPLLKMEVHPAMCVHA
jgi:hypothetical protein